MGSDVAADRAVGLGVASGALALLGAVVMYVGGVGHEQVVAGWGFALAMTAGALVVAALHVYG